MNGIIGAAEILITLDISQEQKRILAIIRNSAFSLLRVINNILGVSKIDAGNIIIEESRTDLQSLLRALLFLNCLSLMILALSLSCQSIQSCQDGFMPMVIEQSKF